MFLIRPFKIIVKTQAQCGRQAPKKEEKQVKWIGRAMTSVFIVAGCHWAFHCMTQFTKTFYSEHLLWYEYEHEKIHFTGWWIERLACPLANVYQSLPNKAKILLKQLSCGSLRHLRALTQCKWIRHDVKISLSKVKSFWFLIHQTRYFYAVKGSTVVPIVAVKHLWLLLCS